MNRLKVVISLFCMGLLFMMSPSNAKASEWNEKTIETFSEPVEVPGMALPAGTYVFRLLDSDVASDIVQIFNADETHLYATILAIPDYRLKPTDKPVMRFEERSRKSPEAIQAWFYPGRQYGEEFVYPREKAMEIAKRTNHHVLFMRSDLASNITKPTKSAKDTHVAALEKASVKAISPKGKEVEMKQVVASKSQK